MSILYVVATPIGNLEDISRRAINTLKAVDFILCEDTRHTLRLLNHFEIKKTLISYHQHSKVHKINEIIDLLREGKSLALVSDAGTPAISDPGGVLVSEIVRQLPEVSIVPIPGPSAVTSLASVAGLPTDKFLFLGFLPHKKGKKTLLEEISESKRTVIFYESPHRILKTLESLKELMDESRQIVIGRELTKKFETIYRGNIREVLTSLEKDMIKGEFVVLVEGQK